jgi:hypothetical protein
LAQLENVTQVEKRVDNGIYSGAIAFGARLRAIANVSELLYRVHDQLTSRFLVLKLVGWCSESS